MIKPPKLLMLLALSALMQPNSDLLAEEILLAVASNFASTMKTLANRFEDESKHQLVLSFGSTGKQYAQIMNGAPFDAFFAADSRRPELLEASMKSIPDSRFTYARGKIVLWSPRPDYVDNKGLILGQGAYRHLAIANPRLAPYGEAAQQVLVSLSLWDELAPRLVRGENINQAFQFVSSGNAELGIIAWSQLITSGNASAGSHWAIPQSLYASIEQQAVLLNDRESVRSLMAFVRGPVGSKIIRDHGYGTPDAH